MPNLPQPDQIAREHSSHLTAFIAEKIETAGGKIPFSDYMNFALYAPGLGYYSAGSEKFGRAGDFITAPELSPIFGQSIANSINPLCETLSAPVILELGAGSGKLAAVLLQVCPVIQSYYILEVSAELRTRQQQTLQSLCPDVISKVHWLDCLPEQKICGVIIANEVVDAFPATRFCWKDQHVFEYFVRYVHQRFEWHLDQSSNPEINSFVNTLSLPSLYTSEMHLLLKPWINSLSSILNQGLILLFDYGFPRHEFYHPDRNQGTLMCHYRHYTHHDPFFYPGLQDITAHVDFTAIAEAAHAAELTIAGYTTQAAFLLECGILNFAKTPSDNNAIKTLTLPSEMGEIFKVIAMSKNIDHLLKGFQLQDRRNRL